MFLDAFFLIALLVILAGIGILALTRQKRADLSLPSGQLIYEDSPEKPGHLLYSYVLRISGKPDALIKQGEMIIPVEVKTGNTPKDPYEGHILQLAAYCHLIEQTYNVRPDYGIIRYAAREFRVPYTAKLEQQLGHIVEELREKRASGEIHRNHSRRAKCSACGFREVCSERLDSEYQHSFEG